MDCKKCRDLGFDDEGAECQHCMHYGDAFICSECGLNPVDHYGDICVWCEEFVGHEVNIKDEQGY
jgi:hypothetical protein